MPFLAPDQNEEDKQNQENGQAASQGQILSGPNAAPIQGTSGQAATTSQGASPKGTASGSFTNLKSYLTANQGNDAALGGAVKNTVANTAKAADESASQFKTAGSSAIDSGTLRDTNNATSLVKSAATAPIAAPLPPTTGSRTQVVSADAAPKSRAGGFAVSDAQKSAIRSPTTASSEQTSTPQRTEPAPAASLASLSGDDFTRLFNGSYAGPQSVQDLGGYGDIGAAYNKVQGMGQAAGGAKSDLASRKQLLTDTFGTGGQQYRGGEKTLDSFILGAGQGGADALADINNTYGNYATNFDSLSALLNGQIDNARTESGATKQAFRDAVTGTQTALEKRLSDAKIAADARTEGETKALAALKSGNVDAWNPYTNHAVLDYLSTHGGLDGLVSGNTEYSAADMADANDVSNFSALNALLSGAGAGGSNAFTAQDLTAHPNAGINVDLAKIAAGAQGYDKMIAEQQAAAAASPFANAGGYDAGTNTGITLNAFQNAYGGNPGKNGFAGAGVMPKQPSQGGSAQSNGSVGGPINTNNGNILTSAANGLADNSYNQDLSKANKPLNSGLKKVGLKR